MKVRLDGFMTVALRKMPQGGAPISAEAPPKDDEGASNPAASRANPDASVWMGRARRPNGAACQ
jgi:hypothetical protein